MKPTKSNHIVLALALLTCLSTLNLQLSTAFAQGTAFSYQGRLDVNGNPANGSYDFRFKLYSDPLGNTQVGASYLTNAIPVTAGLFITTIDFGAGIFTGSNYWLEVDVKTNNAGSYTVLSPLQVVTPTPYAIMANTASNLLGTLPVAQLSAGTANISISGNATTATTANNFSGSLSGDVTGTQGATTVANVGGQTAANVAGGASAANTATSANTANMIVKRDASGNFSASTVTANLTGNATTATTANNFSGSLSGDVTGTQSATVVSSVGGQTAADVASGASAANAATSAATVNTIVKRDATASFSVTNLTLNGNLNLPATTSGSGIIYSGGSTLIHTYGGKNFFAGPGAGNLKMSGLQNVGVGYMALSNNTTGGGNVANGDHALYNNTTGGGNTAIGNGALCMRQNGYNNTAIGGDALGNSGSSGNNNIALGFGAGQFLNSANNNNIEIGHVGGPWDNNIIRIGTQGTQTNTFIAGIYGATAASGVAVYVNSSGLLGTLTSSRKYKQDIRAMDDASDALLALHPVTFRYKPDIDPAGIPQFGLVAEDVEKVNPDLVAHDNQGRPYTVRYEAINAMLLNEFLKEHKTVEAQNTEIQDLKQSVAELKAMVEKLAGK